MAEEKDWKKDIEDYCKEFNLPIEHLVDTLREPKVIPMIRGKAFEFSAVTALKKVLPSKTWDVTKIRIECKLAGKGRFRSVDDSRADIAVKCMRSRTLGASMVAALAPQFGVSEAQLATHNDQYLPTDFDVVLTSIANAFYITDPITEQFVWNPTGAGKKFLEQLSGGEVDDLQDFAFNQIFLAKTNDIVISKNTGIKCTRRSCSQQDDCGFIPNYPIIKFENGHPINNWFSIENAEEFFTSLIEPSQ